MAKYLFVDFESRCTVKNLLLDSGQHKYAMHSGTDILLCNFRMEGKTETWYASTFTNKLPNWVIEAIENESVLLSAYNAGFEIPMWNYIAVPIYGFPKVPIEKWHCSMVASMGKGLPRGLSSVGSFLGLSEQKDSQGSALMKSMCEPIKTGKDGKPVFYWSKQALQRLGDYCEQDTATEEALSKAVGFMEGFELEFWHCVQKMNSRGVCLDIEALKGAEKVIERVLQDETELLNRLTGGMVQTLGQLKKIKEWSLSRGYNLGDSLDKEALSGHISYLERRGHQPEVLEVLKIRERTRAAVGKVAAFLTYSGDDNRIRDQFLCNGAGRTKRLSSQGAQLQNMPRGSLKFHEAKAVIEILRSANVDEEKAYRSLKHLAFVRKNKKGETFDFSLSALDYISSSARLFVRAAPGHRFITADYSAIEARVAPWLAGDEEALIPFKKGIDIYLLAAEKLFRVSGMTKESHPYERQIGKVICLSYQYQMGSANSRAKCDQDGIDLFPLIDFVPCPVCKEVTKPGDRMYGIKTGEIEKGKTWIKHYVLHKGSCDQRFSEAKSDFMKYMVKGSGSLFSDPFDDADVVTTYLVEDFRSSRPKIVQAWKDCSDAALSVVSGKDKEAYACKCTFSMEGTSLVITLPSGSSLYYRNAEAEKNGNIRFLAERNKKIVTERLYPGKYFEHITQATAGDIMKFATIRAERRGYPIVFSVHDELGAEVPVGQGSLKEFVEILVEKESWMDGLPLEAEGWEDEQFHKG